MATSPILTLACLSCKTLFKKDLALFGDKDEVCPHCGVRWIKEAETNEGRLYGMGMEEIEDMIKFACEGERGISVESDFDKIGVLKDNVETVPGEGGGGGEEASRRKELEERRVKMMKLKSKRNSKKT